MLHDDVGWRLSPAFDLVPNIGFNRDHVLCIGLDNRVSNFKTLMDEAKHFGIKRRQQAIDIMEEVHQAVEAWSDIFTAYDVPEKDAESIGKDINQRLKTTDSSS